MDRKSCIIWEFEILGDSFRKNTVYNVTEQNGEIKVVDTSNIIYINGDFEREYHSGYKLEIGVKLISIEKHIDLSIDTNTKTILNLSTRHYPFLILPREELDQILILPMIDEDINIIKEEDLLFMSNKLLHNLEDFNLVIDVNEKSLINERFAYKYDSSFKNSILKCLSLKRLMVKSARK